MSIIFKYLLRNIKEKKSRCILIILAITFTTSIFIVNFGVKSSLIEMYTDKYKSMVGEADIIVTPNQDINKPFFEAGDIKSGKADTDYIVGAFCAYGKYKESSDSNIRVNLIGVDFNHFNKMNPVTLIEKDGLDGLTGDQVIISKKASEKYGFKLGDEISFDVNGKSQKVKVAAIAGSTGIFIGEVKSISFLISKETVNGYYDLENKINMAYINLKSGALEESISDLKDANKDLLVKEAIDKRDMVNQTSAVDSGLTIALAIILLISFYIISSVFKVIMAERIPVMGTFRSIGSTKRQTNFILLLESTLYGLIGGALGVLTGCIALRYTADALNTMKEYGIKTVVEYNQLSIIAAFVFAVVVSILSALLPIISSNKYSTKDIILNTVQVPQKFSLFGLISGIVLIGASWGLNIINKYNLLLSILVLILLIVGYVCIIPFITSLVSRLFVLIFGKIDSTAVLAAKNMKNNKLIINNIVLTAVALGLVIMIMSVASSLQAFVFSVNNTGAEIYIRNFSDSKEICDRVQKVNGVEKVYENYVTRMKVYHNDKYIVSLGIYPIDSKGEFFDFYDGIFKFDSGKDTVLSELGGGRNIIVDRHIAYLHDLKKGDTVKLRSRNKENAEYEYKIIGFYDTKIATNREVASISFDNYKQDIGLGKPIEVLVISSIDNDKLAADLSRELTDTNAEVITAEEEINYQKETLVDNIFNMLKIFVGLAMAMGLLGMVNNLIISFIQRKRELAVLYSVCMSKAQLRRTILFETIISFLTASLLGGVLGILINSILEKLLGSIGLVINAVYSMSSIGILMGAVFVVLSVSSIVPMVKSSKMNIVQELKYE